MGGLAERKLVRGGRFGRARSRGRRWRKRVEFDEIDFETKRQTCGGVGIRKGKRLKARVKARLMASAAWIHGYLHAFRLRKYALIHAFSHSVHGLLHAI